MTAFRILPRLFYSEGYAFFGHGGDVESVLWLVNRPWALLCIIGGTVAAVWRISSGVRRRRTGQSGSSGVLHGD